MANWKPAAICRKEKGFKNRQNKIWHYCLKEQPADTNTTRNLELCSSPSEESSSVRWTTSRSFTNISAEKPLRDSRSTFKSHFFSHQKKTLQKICRLPASSSSLPLHTSSTHPTKQTTRCTASVCAHAAPQNVAPWLYCRKH